MSLYYLKATIKAEPLIWQWYAWSYLIPPLTAACNIAERHLKIMQSYVQNPQIHAQAIKDPKLLGGPFIDLEGEKVDEIKTLLEQTKKDCQELLTLHTAFKETDRMIQAESRGDTLEPFYNRIPNPLKGMVELVYDLNNHPSLRLIEPLLYRKYYNTQHQRIVLSDTVTDFRKFVLSTPYLNQEDAFPLDIAFSDPKIDQLFKLKREPKSLAEIQELFDIPETKQELFKSFFTTERPSLHEDRNYMGDGVRIRYFGHACLLVQTKSVSLLFDPVISYPIKDSEIPRYTFEDLPDHIDYVVITHNHQDHLMFEPLLQIRHKIGHIVIPTNHKGSLEDPSLRLTLQHTGFSSLIEAKEMESIPLPDGELISLPFFGEHSDLNIQSKLSHCVRLKGKKFLFAADSNNLEPTLYNFIFENIGPVDMLFLGMECDGAPLSWLYGPLLSTPLIRSFDRNRTLSGSNFEKAWDIVQKLQCKKVYIYAMGQEPWLNYVMALKYQPDSIQITESDKLVQTCKKNNIEAERLFGRREWIISP